MSWEAVGYVALTLALLGVGANSFAHHLAPALACCAAMIAVAVIASRWREVPRSPLPSSFNVDDVVRAHEWAQDDRRHGEAITQTRLNNYLFSSSILIVAWAAVYANDVTRHFSVLQVLSGANFALSLAYGFFGVRNKRALSRHRGVVLILEEGLPPVLQTTHALERGTDAERPTAAGEQFRGISTHDMLWGLPAGLLVVSTVLFGFSGP